MKIELRDPASLIPYPFNNKKHSPKQIGSIIESIKEFGFVQPVVTDRDGIIVIGHARVEAAKKMGIGQVPVLVLQDATDHQTKRLRLLDNRLSDLGEYDVENIKLEIEALGDEDLAELFKDIDLEPEETPAAETAAKDALRERFGVPPFSILDSRQGYWRERKSYWKEIIGDNGESRENTLFGE